MSPTITSLSTSSGVAIGGVPVTISGTNFTSDATVMFGLYTANDIVFVSSTEITCTTPAAVGLLTVTVEQESGTATLPDSYTGTPMPVALYSTNPGTTDNYVKYIYDTPVKSDRDGDSILLNFTLADVDENFVQLRRGNYIIFTTQTYPLWFTGYITNEPEYVYLGEQSHVPHWGFKYQASSDDYLLSLNPLGILPPFMNMTQGQIIKSLVNTIAPGKFDVSNVQDGILLARYVVDPTQKFADVIKVFAQNAVYRFYGQNGYLYYTPKTELPQGLTANAMGVRFTPSNLTVKASTSIPIINDCLVMGDVEPQRYTREYFIGDGITGEQPLSASVFGVDSVTMLNDFFDSSTINTSNWTVYDEPANYLQVSNGFLNCVGGNGNTDGVYNVHLDSVSLIQLAGAMRFAHGEFDFVPQNEDNLVTGVICGLWTQEPNTSYTGCVYGIQVSKSYGIVSLNPIVNGTVDTTQSQICDTNGQAGNPAPWNSSVAYSIGNTVTYEGEYYTCIATTAPDIEPINDQYWAISTAKRYVIRTIVSSNTLFPVPQTYSYLDAEGVLQHPSLSSGPAPIRIAPLNPSIISYHTYITELDPNTGLITDGYPIVWTNYFPSSIDNLYVLYVYMASEYLHLTATGVTISTPMQCTLGIQEMGQATPQTTGGFLNKLVGPNEIDATDGLAPYATITDSSGGKNVKSSVLGTPTYNFGAPLLAFFSDQSSLTTTTPHKGDVIRLDYRSAGAALGRARDQASVNLEQINWGDSGVRSVVHNGDLNPLPQTSGDCILAAAAIIGQNAFTHYEGTYMVPSQNVTAEPLAGAVLTFDNLPADFPVTTFTEPISLVSTTFDGWNGLLEVFNHTITYGLKNDSVRLLSVLSGFQKQDNVFTVTDTTEVPNFIPVTGVGLAFAPDVTMPGMDPYQNAASSTNPAGTVYHNWSAGTPYSLGQKIIDYNGNLQQVQTAGTSGASAPAWANATNNVVVIGSVVQSSFVSVTNNIVTITSPVDVSGMLNIGTVLMLSGFSSATFLNGETATVLTIDGTYFTFAFDNPDYPNTSDVGIGTVTASGGVPLTTPDGTGTLVWNLIGHAYGVDENYFYYDMGQDPPVGGSFEIRYTDAGWGCDSGGNLAGNGQTGLYGSIINGRSTSRYFALPRTVQNIVIFVKAQDGRNVLLSSEIWVQGSSTSTDPNISKYLYSAWTVNVSNFDTAPPNVAVVIGIDSQGDLKLLNQKTFSTGGDNDSLTQDVIAAPYGSSGYFGFTVSADLKGPKGEWLTLTLADVLSGGSVTGGSIQFTGQWQRFSVTHLLTGSPSSPSTADLHFSFVYPIPGQYGVPLGYTPAADITVLGSRAAIENAPAETIYCKTVDEGTALYSPPPTGGYGFPIIPYGANSQYAASVVCRYPFIPNPPTGFVDLTDPTNPIINIVLPSVADDVWGVEIRASDDVTVLYQSNLTDSGYAPTYTVADNSARTLSYYLYTYNLLGEYSVSYYLTVTITTPFIVEDSLQVVGSSQTLEWQAENSTSYLVQVDHTGSGFLTDDQIDTFTVQQNPANVGVAVGVTAGIEIASLLLSDADFYGTNWFGVTPMDAVGSGTMVSIGPVQYTPPAPANGFSGINEIITWTIYGYSGEHSGYPASNSISGNSSLVWWNGVAGGTPLDQYIMIAFNVSQTFNAVNVNNRTGGANRGQPNAFSIYTANTTPDPTQTFTDGVPNDPSWTLQGSYTGDYDYDPHTYTFAGGSVSALFMMIVIASIFGPEGNGAVVGQITTSNSGGTGATAAYSSGTVDPVNPPSSTGDIVVPSDVSAGFSGQYTDYVKNTYGAQSITP